LNVLYLGVNFSLNYICFKEIGIYGAAVGNVIGCTLGAIVWYSILKKSIGVQLKNVFRHTIDTYKTVFTTINSLVRTRQVQL
jgi:Na+-driven multidrug efflux pump